MKKNNFLFPAALAALILSDPALAAAGTQSLNNTLQTILSVFQGASLLIVTGAAAIKQAPRKGPPTV